MTKAEAMARSEHVNYYPASSETRAIDVRCLYNEEVVDVRYA